VKTSGIDGLTAWRIRPTEDGGYKLENISEDASDCLGSTYLGWLDTVYATYESCFPYATQEKINLS
jgi:hypothetical protein